MSTEKITPSSPSARRFVFAAALILLTVVALTAAASGRKPKAKPPATGLAVPVGATGWKEVDRLVSEQKFEAASAAVDRLLADAKSKGNEAEWTRALVTKAQLRIGLHGYETAVRDLRDEPWPDGLLGRSAIRLFYGWSLVTYIDAYSWEIRQRERVEAKGPVDLKAWTVDQIFAEAATAYTELLGDREALGEIPVAGLAPYLAPNSYPAGVRPTLRDASTYLFAELLSNSSHWRPEQSNELFRLDFSRLLAGETDPGEITDAARHPLERAVAALSELERWHDGRGEGEAALEAALERYRRLHAAFSGERERRAIVAALERRLEGRRGLDWWSMGMAQLADFVRELDDDGAPVRARDLAKAGAAAHPATMGGQRCTAIVASLEAPDYQVQMMTSDGVGRRSLQVTHRNVGRLFFRAFRFDVERQIAGAKDYELMPDWQEMRALADSGRPDASWDVELPATPDLRSHKTFVTPPMTAKGAWVVLASARADFAESGNRVAGTHLLLTDLVLLTSSRTGGGVEVAAIRGGAGRPAGGTRVELWRFDWQKGHRKVLDRTAGPDGRVELPPSADLSGGNFFLFARNGDDLALDRSWLNLYPEGTPAESTASLVYTDRSIYRPGQKILWKVVAWKGTSAEGRFSTLPGSALSVSLRDVNGEIVETKSVSTNRYGSASGEFVIPSGRLLGAWRVISSLSGQAQVRVEEYKRPTFEVSLKEPASPLRLNRKAELAGEARYYFGLPVAAGKVAWRVTREPVYSWWWYACSRWWGHGGRTESVRAQAIAQGISELRPDGTFALSFTPEADESADRNAEVTWRYAVSADVTDDGGETRSAQRSFRLGFVAVEASLSTDTAFFLEGTRVADAASKGDIRVVRTDLDGTPRKGAGSWTLVKLAQPAKAVTPAEMPPPELAAKGSKERLKTPGDLLRARWDAPETLATILRGWKDGATVASGPLAHDDKGEAWVRLPPLAAGPWRLRYRTKDDFGADYETTKEFLVAGDERTPVAVPAILAAERASVPVGGTARILVRSGLSDQPMTLDVFRSGKRVERRTLLSGQNDELIEFPVRETDRGGFGVTLSLVRDHQPITLATQVFVPWDDRQLTVELATFRDRLRPGQKESWTVTVKGADGAAVDRGAAELLAYMYDRSLDLFAPHYPASPLSLYPNRTGTGWTRSNLGSHGAGVLRESGFASVPGYPTPIPDRLTYFDNYGIGGMGARGRIGGVAGGVMAAMPASAPVAEEMRQRSDAPAKMARKNGVESKEEMAGAKDQLAKQDRDERDAKGNAPAEADPAPLRSNFSETAFWQPHLVTGPDGSATFEFQVPDSVTSWNVWVHALTNDLRAGSVKKEARTVKELMVRPYLPRFLREGDQAEIRVAVNNAGEKPLSGRMQVELLDPETNRSLASEFGLTATAASQPFSVAPSAGVTLVVPLTAPIRVGSVAVKVTATAAGLSDGELRPLPLLPGRMHLVQSRFVTLRDRDRRTMTFEDLARGDDPTLVNDQMVVTVDAQLFYSVLTSLPYLVNYPYECTEQTMNRFLSTGIVTSVYDRFPAVAEMAKKLSVRDTRLETWASADPNRKLALEETPWVFAAKGGSEPDDDLANTLDPRIAKATREAALARLLKAQTSLGAWPWFEGGPPSPWITLYILNGFSRALEFGVEVPKEPVVRGWAYLHRHFIDELVRYAIAKDCCWEFVTFLNFVLSNYPDSSWTGGVFTDAERKTMLDFSFRHWKRHSPLTKGYLAMTLQRAGRPADAKLVFDSVMDSSKTTRDEGTFWAPEDRAWLWYNDTVESHAFALRVLMELSPKDARADGLVQWLLLNKKLNHWKSTRATAEAIYSLVHFLKREGTLGIPENAKVTVGSRVVEFAFDPKVYTGKKNQVVIPGPNMDARSDSTVVVEKTSKGFAFASATWHFSTEKLPAEARGDFLSVQRRFFLREKQGSDWVLRPLEEGARLAPGDQVEVQLSIRAKHEAEYVHLRDPRGAGFEPDNPVSRFKWDLGIGWYEEIRDSATNFFFERLPVGEYTFKYRIRAATAGTFKVGPATLQSMYAPEFAAYSSGAKLAIAAPASGGAKVVPGR